MKGREKKGFGAEGRKSRDLSQKFTNKLQVGWIQMRTGTDLIRD